MTRAEKVAEAQRLRAEGLKLREIAERMGASVQTVGAWISDPDLSKQRQRRQRYAGRCVDCGKPTDGSNGSAKAPKRCLDCTRRLNEERDARVLEAWGRGDTAPDIAVREGLTRPQVMGIVDHSRRRKGRTVPLHRLRNRELWPEIERRYRAGDTPTQIAAALGLKHPQNVSEMLAQMRRAGVDVPYQRPWAAGPRKAAA